MILVYSCHVLSIPNGCLVVKLVAMYRGKSLWKVRFRGEGEGGYPLLALLVYTQKTPTSFLVRVMRATNSVCLVLAKCSQPTFNCPLYRTLPLSVRWHGGGVEFSCRQ